ncbi:MAG TPA: TonB family protein [Gemmatimonadota bacterium]|nr:TonB family protein [Gemmatimonadota bacterium]
MFETSFTQRSWKPGERAAWWRSVGIAVLIHVALVVLLLRVAGTVSEELLEQTTSWLLVGPPGPGGGVNELAAPGAVVPRDGAPEEPPVPEEAVEDEIPLEEPDETPVVALSDSIPMPTDAVALGDSAEGGALGAPGLFAGGGGGSGGGAGGGTTGGFGPGSGGQGAVRPLHLVVPRIPRDVDERRARGRTVRLLLEVLPDGTVGDLQVEAGSQISALDSAAVKAARQLRYSPPADEGIMTSVWTRAVMRF